MTMIAANTSATATTTQQNAAPSSPSATISSDFETFLKMLTVQMKNQDPLNPADATEFSMQLATFSALEQQVLTNQLLKGLPDAMVGSALEGSAYLGRAALIEGPVRFAGQPLALTVEADREADTAILVVRDASGAEIQRLSFDPEESQIEWAGTHPDGQPMPYGTYSFAVESSVNGVVTATRPALSPEVIIEVRRRDNGTLAVLASGATVALDEIVGLRLVPDT